MKKIISILLFVFMISSSGFAQTATDTYLQQENTRIANANATEQLIATFITNNLSSYNLTQARLSQVTSPVNEGVTQTLTGQALQDAILAAKKVELRKLYFQQNPSSLAYYKSATIPASVPCLNGGFEDNGGTTAGYSFVSEKYNIDYASFTKLPTNIPQVGPAEIITLVDNSLNDPITNLPRVNSGTHAIRLNNANSTRNVGGWYTVSGLSKTFTVNQNFVSFNFALVLADGGHAGTTQNPYFQYKLLNQNGVVIDHNEIMANPNPLTFHTSAYQIDGITYTIRYTDWGCANINTSQYIGQDVTLQIYVGDCGQGGHFGYVYLDDFCGVACASPTFGSLNINPLNINCPSFPMTVSGTFSAPTNNTISANLTTLNIINSSNVIVGTVSNPVITGNTYTFTVNQTNIFGANTPTIGNFEVKVNATFILNGSTFQTVLTQQSANSGVDISFNNCINASITLNPVNENCPLFPLDVKGSFIIPSGASITNIKLEILNSAGAVMSSLLNPTVIGNTFSFPVNLINFGTASPMTGNFEFRISATVTLGSLTSNITSTSSNPGSDVSFSNCSVCCITCCVDNQSLSSPVVNGADNRQAALRIVAVNKIDNTSTAIYHAGNYVLLKNGFQAMAGSRTHFYIRGCGYLSDPNEANVYVYRQSSGNVKQSSGSNVTIDNEMQNSNNIELVLNDKKNITIQPNPNNGIFKINLKEVTEGTIAVTDLYGFTVYKSDFKNQNEFEMNLQDNPKGVYIVKVVSGDQTYTSKIIKN
jgi:hypothetical protein